MSYPPQGFIVHPKIYEKLTKIAASKLGTPPTNPASVVVYGITHALKFTVNTDKTYHKVPLEYDYAGGTIKIHVHWTKSTNNSDQSTKSVKWQFKYLYISTGNNCNSGESTTSIEDTYDSATNETQIIQETDNIELPAQTPNGHGIYEIEIMAVTPAGTILDDEPALIWIDVIYDAYNVIT